MRPYMLNPLTLCRSTGTSRLTAGQSCTSFVMPLRQDLFFSIPGTNLSGQYGSTYKTTKTEYCHDVEYISEPIHSRIGIQ